MSNQSTTRACPICQQYAREILHTQRFALPKGHPLSEGYNVVCCDGCGFVFADTAVTQHDYDVFYAQFSKYEDAQTSTGGGDSPSDALRLQNTAKSIIETLPSRDARILDIGCANGGLLAAFKEQGYDQLVGIDPSSVCAGHTSQRLNIPTFAGSIYDLPALGKFDCVVLSHVMEHLSDLRNAAQVIAELLKPEGLLYVEVPDASRYTQFLIAPFQDFNTEHINHFSHRCLANLLAVASLSPISEGEKNIESASNVPYPAFYAFYRKIPTVISSQIKDVQLKTQILTYINASREMMKTMDGQIQTFLRDHPRIIVWGTGQLAAKLLAETSLRQADIAAFVDTNPINQGKFLQGSEIVAPSRIGSLPYPILITSTIHQAAISDTIRNKLHLTNKILLLDKRAAL